MTCVDWYPSQPRFEVVYELLSIPKKERVRLKVRLDNDSPALESVTSVWPSANYFEREVFDLFGIRFVGHPYLRRIQMPEDWEGHPLRKDYPWRAIARLRYGPHDIHARVGTGWGGSDDDPEYGTAASLHSRRVAADSRNRRRDRGAAYARHRVSAYRDRKDL